ncbi:tRNA-splicing endonuclease subunit Sen34 [Apophysomyces ossiformis]|uniref:tRNA-intron lyase n=1 Tax=Apophysomyces ossiformis TaxID=679940 RepID=A0A8H7EN72_9FUNG|nr:tRNA-splicing endonuclease subunit Sen34 [Apophysomyces ossiformis]
MHFATFDGEWTYPDSKHEKAKSRVFEYLWRQGLYITNGSKFGGDYLAYPGDPMKFHSHYVVGVHDSHQTLTPLDIIGMGRLATNVKKTYVIAATVNTEEAIETFSVRWAGF